jgi:hypothetical protein
MAIIWDTRNNAGGFGGDYTNGNWSSFMNQYAVRFTSATSGPGSAFEGVTFNRSYSVFFPYSGNYTVTTAADNFGTLNIGGVNFTVPNFTASATTVRYYNKGTYTLSLSVVNAPSSNNYAPNPYGIAITVDAPPQPPAPSISFSISSSSIIFPGSSTISWSTFNATSVFITNIGANLATSGSRTVSPSATTTYTIIASGEGGTVTRSATVTVTYQPPSVSFSITPTSICRGSTATLSWNVTGAVNSVFINQGIGSVAASGSRTVGPTSSTTYTITATGPGGTTTRSVTLTVNQPTTTSITADSTAIIRGQCTTLRWTTTGNATSATINQGIGSVNINGNRQVCPTETTTYTINVAGICTNSSSSVTVIVYQPPTVNLTDPGSLNYGQQGTLIYNATDADISLRITPSYAYNNGGSTGSVINLPIGASVNGTITTQIPYNDFGPFFVSYTIVATGNGGQETKQITFPINVDQTPNNFLVPESEDLFKDQAPIFTPDSQVTTYKIVIDDIDIPVEVKSDKPILIDKNEQQDWKPIRRI